MIQFFRKLRHRLLKENRFSKYLLYAIGEIVLVMIGILMAMQINDWNNDRKDRTKEAAILKQIHRDFKSNRLQLDSIIQSNKKMQNGVNRFMETLLEKPDSSAIDTLLKYRMDILNIKTFNATNSAVESLINSSSFELIQNDSLRDLLVSWKDAYLDYIEEEQLARTFQIAYLTPYLRENFDFFFPYSDHNLKVIKTMEFRNIWQDKRLITNFVLKATEEERIIFKIDEILRLSATKND